MTFATHLSARWLRRFHGIRSRFSAWSLGINRDQRSAVLTQLTAVAEALQREVADRERAIGSVRDDATAMFAVEELAPVRLAAVREHLREQSLDDLWHFERFLDGLEGEMCDGIRAASSADDLAEAVLCAVQDLHAYVLAYGVVDDGYAAAEEASLVKRGTEAGSAATTSTVTDRGPRRTYRIPA
jgi:hypothetical protein